MRLQQQLLLDYKLDPKRLIHALQNHDNISYELIHFTHHGDQKFNLGEQELSGNEINNKILDEAQSFCKKNNLIFDYGFGGILSNLVDVCRARDQNKILDLMELLVFYSAMQPGILQLSAWDLLGAQTLNAGSITDFIADGDLRWLARGGYDLLDQSEQSHSEFGVPRSNYLFGPIDKQLSQSRFFCFTS